MFFRRYWLTFIFFLIWAWAGTTWAWAGTTAKQLTAHEARYDDVPDGASNPKGLAEQPSSNFFQYQVMQWLSGHLLPHPQELQKKRSIVPYLPHQGKTISLIQLDKHRAWSTEDSRWEWITSIIVLITKDSVILGELSFMPGDAVIPHQLLSSQEQLNRVPCIKEAYVTVQTHQGSNDAANIHIVTRDKFPIGPGLGFDPFGLSIKHNNFNGWGHILENKLPYDHGIGYGITYRAPNINRTGIVGELQYLYTPQRGIKQLRVFRDFSDQTCHAGKIEFNKIRKIKRRILDGSTKPQKIPFSFYSQCIWLGTTYRVYPGDKHPQARFFVTGKLARQHFVDRPAVAEKTNRYFHHHVFGLGSLGFSNQKHYEDRLVHGAGHVESVPYGSAVNLIGGYQVGEFVHRPYLQLNIARGGRIQQLGHLYGAIQTGGFWHEKTIEQGVIRLQLDYFTPLLEVGNQRLRQFIRFNYLSGHNMLTGELISTHMHKVSAYLRDPFPGGTQRIHLGLETVLIPPRLFLSYRVAALGFVEGVRLQDAQGKVKQNSFCKALGIGFRGTHSNSSAGTLQVTLGYSPLVQNWCLAFSITTTPSSGLEIGEPNTISFHQY